MPHLTDEQKQLIADRATRIGSVSIAVADPVGLEFANLAWSAMDSRWKKLEDLREGSEHMREQTTTYLPKFNQESDQGYSDRVSRTFLLSAFEDGIDNFVSKPYARNIVVTGADDDEQIQKLIKDMDGTGTSLTQWGKEAFEAANIYGYTHGITDFATMPVDATKEDEDAAKPNIIHITPRMLFAWRHDENDELDQIRYREIRTEPHDMFGEIQREYIRVVTKTEWVIYRRDVDVTNSSNSSNERNSRDSSSVVRKQTGNKSQDVQSEWIIVDAGIHTFGRVPLTTYFITKTDLNFSNKPTHEGLADANIEHYQKKSDQDNILHHVKVPFIFAAGFPDNERQLLVVGASRAVFSSDPEAKVSYVEHGGTAIESGAKDLENIERRMEVLGMQPFINRGGTTTATERTIDEADKEADIKAWIRNEEKFLTDLFLMALQWTDANAELPTDFKVDIFNDFTVTTHRDMDLRELREAALKGLISREIYFGEIQRRGMIKQETTFEDNEEQIANDPLAQLLLAVNTGVEPDPEDGNTE